MPPPRYASVDKANDVYILSVASTQTSASGVAVGLGWIYHALCT